MKKTLFLFAFTIFALNAEAQIKTPTPSPSATVKQVVGLTDVEVVYSRPSMKGRTIFGDLVPFGKPWRTGANKNTTVSFSEDVVIGGKTLPSGKYALYTIPKADNWEVFFYKDTDNSGLPEEWDDSKVALKAVAKPESLNRNVESFTIGVNGLDNNSGFLELSWEKMLLPIKFEVPTDKTAMASINKVMAGPGSNDYFSAGQYLFQSNGDMTKALDYVNKAIDLNKNKPFWMYRVKSLIQAKMGDKKGAVETAKTSLALATEAKNADYMKMNSESIAEWSKK